VVPNPIVEIAAVGDPEESPVEPAVIILLVVLAAAAFGSLVLRFRRSRSEERQQLKWFTYAAALVPLTAAPAGVLPAPLDNLVFAVLTVCLRVASGIAILRYRLYDIDRRDPGRGGAVPAGPPPHPASGGSTVQLAQVRCRQDGGGVQRPLAG
jgi:hypothetical protein